jgi:hypothetical protein
MKKIVVALAACFAFAQGGFAAEAVVPDNAAAVRELLDAMNYRTTTKATMDQMSRNIPAMMRQQAEAAIKADSKLTDAQRAEKLAKLESELPKLGAVVQGVLNDPALMVEMEGEMLALYARHFTAEELKQMAAYYRTPVGKKTMQLMPQVMTEAVAISQRITLPRLQKAIEQFQKK